MTVFFRKSAVASRMCKYRGNNTSIVLNVLFIFLIWNTVGSMVLLSSLKQNNTAHHFIFTNMLKRTLPGKHYGENYAFTVNCMLLIFISTSVSWIVILLLQSGDIELNPGPYSDVDNIISDSSSNSSSLSITTLSNHLSMVHYNVKSIGKKIDILSAELRDFDILAFSETWLNSSVKSDTLLLTITVNLRGKIVQVIVMVVS